MIPLNLNDQVLAEVVEEESKNKEGRWSNVAKMYNTRTGESRYGRQLADYYRINVGKISGFRKTPFAPLKSNPGHRQPPSKGRKIKTKIIRDAIKKLHAEDVVAVAGKSVAESKEQIKARKHSLPPKPSNIINSS